MDAMPGTAKSVAPDLLSISTPPTCHPPYPNVTLPRFRNIVMPEPISARLPAGRYTIVDSPDPLTDADGDRCEVLPDDQDLVIWCDPELTPDRKLQAVLDAVSYLWVR